MPRSLQLLADQAFSRAAGAPLVAGNEVDLLADAQQNYPAWLEAIAAATAWVHFECYIIHDDATGARFKAALIERARAGVAVRVLFDWLGAVGATSRRFVRDLHEAGVEVRAFNRPRPDRPLAWLSRDHRKMLGVDGRVAFVSGLCVGDAWTGDPARGIEPWRDTGVAIRGPAVADVERAFADVWAAAGPPLPPLPHAPSTRKAAADLAVRVIATEPASAEMYRLDQLVCALARERLWITDAYYVGAPAYVQALIAAAGDGVDVRLLVPGASDLPLVQPVTRAGYRTLLEGGVRIFEWNGPMVHAKTAVADGRWSRVGSSNLNLQSWMGNWELDVTVEDEGFGRQMEEMYLRDLANTTEVVVDPAKRVRRRAPRTRRHGRAWSSSGSRRTAAGALRLGNTFGAAVTARRVLGPAEALGLVYGAILLAALAFIALKWPRGLAWPVGIFAIWMALSWLLEALRLTRRDDARRRATTPPSTPAGDG